MAMILELVNDGTSGVVVLVDSGRLRLFRKVAFGLLTKLA